MKDFIQLALNPQDF